MRSNCRPVQLALHRKKIRAQFFPQLGDGEYGRRRGGFCSVFPKTWRTSTWLQISVAPGGKSGGLASSKTSSGLPSERSLLRCLGCSDGWNKLRPLEVSIRDSSAAADARSIKSITRSKLFMFKNSEVGASIAKLSSCNNSLSKCVQLSEVKFSLSLATVFEGIVTWSTKSTIMLRQHSIASKGSKMLTGGCSSLTF